MQVVGSRPLALHRRHPDARGLVLAHPLNAQRSDGFQDATGKDGSKWAYSTLPLSAWQTYARGYGIRSDGTLNQRCISPLSQQMMATGSDMTFICSGRLDDAASNFQQILNFSGFAVGFNAGKFVVWSSIGSQFAIATSTAVAGVPFTVGVRYKAATTNYQFFLNGAFDAAGAGTGITYSAVQSYFSGGLGGSGGWNGVISDLRVYGRYMPADTFMRAYRQPLGIYRVVSPSFARFSSAGGRFFPFLRPGY